MNRSTTQTRLPIIKILFKIASTLTLHRSPISFFPLKLRLFLDLKVISEKYIVKANVFYFEEKSKQNGLLMATFPY